MEEIRMSRLTRRKFLAATAGGAGAVTSFGILGSRARAAEFTYKYANNVPVTHPMNVSAREAVEKIKEESGGRLEIQIFPNNQLGGDTDMLSQVRSGAIEFFTLSGLILSTLVPVASINGIGFAFKSYDQVWPAMDGPLGARSEEHTSELQSPDHLVCRLLLEKKKLTLSGVRPDPRGCAHPAEHHGVPTSSSESRQLVVSCALFRGRVTTITPTTTTP